MATIKDRKIEKKEHSSVKLTITIDSTENKKQYDELLDKYAKTAHIKGFRKGKAPVEVLERKFGEGIKHEAMMNLLDSSLQEVFGEIEEKPLPYSQPVLEDEEKIEFSLDSDFSFSVVYDIFPEITPGKYRELKAEVPSCTISDKDIQKELRDIQERNAVVKEKADGKVEKDSIVTINYQEADDSGKEIEGTAREDFVFTVGTGQNLYKIDDDIIGMKKDEEKVITKTYKSDFEDADLAGRTIRLKVRITAVKVKELPKLDDDLAQDVSEKYETLEDLKKDIKDRMEKHLDSALRQKKIDALMDQVIESSKIDVPESMIKAELNNNWRNFLMQSRMQEESLLQVLGAQGKTKEDLMNDWRDGAVKSVKSQLILGKITEEEKIEATDEDIQNEMKNQAEQAGQTEEEVKDYFEKNKLIEYLKDDIKNKKVFDIMIESAKISKGKRIDFMDLLHRNN